VDLFESLRAARSSDPASVPDVVLGLANDIGASDVTIYLVDFAQHILEPVPGPSAHPGIPGPEEIATTMAGRAFIDQRVTVAERADGVRVWVPVVEGSDRTGVLALTVPVASAETLAECEVLGLLTGYLIATHARATDLYNLYRRRRSLTLAASMQWDLLPPLTLKSPRLGVAGLLEPAYEVGGDCFDYALNERFFDVALIDAAGHGIGSALISALAIGSYRHDRREGQGLEFIHAHLDDVLAKHAQPGAFATGQLARIDLETGSMNWTNAGHPLPLLIRQGRVLTELSCPPTVPWGCGPLTPGAVVPVAVAALEPGDCVLFYTDGVIEAHVPGGEQFGVGRLADLASQHASEQLGPEEIVRRLIQSVIEHQQTELADDATLVIVRWDGPSPP